MAPVNRRPGTRSHPSSTQELDLDDFPPLRLDDDDPSSQHEPVLTQVDDTGGVDNADYVITDEGYDYSPQHDNPSALLPDGDDDYALKEYMASQQQISQHFQQEVATEFDLQVDEESSADEEDVNNNTNPTYTQRTLDAASVLANGFSSDNDDKADDCAGLVRREKPVDAEDAAEDEEFMRKYHECNQRNGITTSAAEGMATAEEPSKTVAKSTTVAEPVDDESLAAQIAANLRKDGIGGLTEEEQAFVDNVKCGKNSTKHNATQQSLKKRFFETLSQCGGHLSVLADEEKPNVHDLSSEAPVDKRWFSACGGAKNAAKRKIINDSFVCVFMKWTCKTGKNIGKQCEPSTFDKCMEQLTVVFQDAGAQCSHSQDFNKGGQFHGVVLQRWKDIRKDDPKFGTGRNRARVDKDLFVKFVAAARDGTIRPYEDSEHLVICMIFALGFYCGLRGSEEHINLMTENVFIGEHTAADGEDLNGLRHVGIKVPFSKAKQLKLKQTRLPKDEAVLLTFVEDPHHDCWCPFQVFCYYFSKCHPNAKKFYGRIVKPGGVEEKRLKNEFKKDVWHAESGKGSNWNMGPTKHRDLCREVARLAGVDRWEDCTGHALRALCVTHCICAGLSAADVAAKVRHASMNSQVTHAQECSKRKANRMAAMNPSGTLAKKAKFVPVPPKEKEAMVVELSEKYPVSMTQPFKPENQAKVQRLTGMVPQVASVPPAARLEKNKAIVNVNESPEETLKRLETKNRILKLQQENARMKEELSRNEVMPSRPRQSHPPTHINDSGSRHSRSRCEDRFDDQFGHPDIDDYKENCRHSHPPSRRERPRSSSPPPHYQHNHYRHGDEDAGYGSHHGDFHRRHC